jgi:hypothetical protein
VKVIAVLYPDDNPDRHSDVAASTARGLKRQEETRRLPMRIDEVGRLLQHPLLRKATWVVVFAGYFVYLGPENVLELAAMVLNR